MKIIFKHSYRCPISVDAKEEMDNFLRNNKNDIELELIDVTRNRKRSKRVAKDFGTTHESPQVIILDNNNNVLWTASHRQITKENIKSAVSSSK